MDENEAAIRERLTAVESSVKSAHHRIDVIAGRPSQILTVIITALITATVSGFVGFAITNLLK